MWESFYQLKVAVEAASEDLEKALAGNKAAGTRVRKAMQEVKRKAQEVRQEVMLIRAK